MIVYNLKKERNVVQQIDIILTFGVVSSGLTTVDSTGATMLSETSANHRTYRMNRIKCTVRINEISGLVHNDSSLYLHHVHVGLQASPVMVGYFQLPEHFQKNRPMTPPQPAQR